MSDMQANLKGNSGLTPAARPENSGLTPAARLSDRYWFLTWTTYGTWLPGDDRGFVSNIDRGDGKGHRLNIPGTEPASKMRGLEIMAREKMAGPPVYLNLEQATALLDQFCETATYRDWELIAVAIMRNHVHVVVGVPGDPEPETILGSLKSYGSRRLNRKFGKRESDTWWTESGSKRRLKTESNVLAAIAYVRDQEYPLIVWIADQWSPELASGGRESAVSESAVLESAVLESAVLEGIPDSVKQGADAPRSPDCSPEITAQPARQMASGGRESAALESAVLESAVATDKKQGADAPRSPDCSLERSSETVPQPIGQ